MEKSNEQNTPVQFTTVDPTGMKFSEDYRCARSTAGQVVVGLKWLANNVNSSKEMNNDYQKNLYPTITKMANEVYDKYKETFVTNVTDSVQVQVYGANLNGRFNDGRLKHDIPCKRTDRRARYKYSVLGQLLSLLYDRLLFVSKRDVNKIQRYVDNEEERKHFVSLQQACNQFCSYLRGDDDSVMSRWTKFVNDSRESHGVSSKQPERTESSPSRERDGRGRGRGRGSGLSRGGSQNDERVGNQDSGLESRRGRGSSRGRGQELGQGQGQGRGSSRGRGQELGHGRGSSRGGGLTRGRGGRGARSE